VIDQLLCKNHDIKHGQKLDGYYPLLGAQNITFPTKYFATLQERMVIFFKPFKMDYGEDSYGVSSFQRYLGEVDE
jgi:hypothetical protein